MSEEFQVSGLSIPKWSLVNGGGLFLWGFVAYGLSARVSFTPFIPSLFGGLLLLFGGLAIVDPKRRKHYMHVAMLVALLCVLGGSRLFSSLSSMSALSIASHALLIGSGLEMLWLGFRSFRAARNHNDSSTKT